MAMPEIEARQNELDRICDWLTDHDPEEYLRYYHARGIQLDAQRHDESLAP